MSNLLEDMRRSLELSRAELDSFHTPDEQELYNLRSQAAQQSVQYWQQLAQHQYYQQMQNRQNQYYQHLMHMAGQLGIVPLKGAL